MILPTCGKALIIDDKIEEALPLIKLLSNRGTNTMYYSGVFAEMPENPLEGVRLVFCDLKFNSAPDAKSVASNILSVLKKLIATNNGPYILLVWSTHQNDYIDELTDVLKEEEIKPEFILCLDKADYFETKDVLGTALESVFENIRRINLDVQDEQSIISTIEEKLLPLGNIQHVAHDDAIDKISEKLLEELKKAELFHLFILWENTIGNSALETVNCLYSEIPETVPKDKKIKAMVYYLAHNRLEKRFDEATPELKFWSAMDSLDDLFSYFFEENVHKISTEPFDLDTITDIEQLGEISSSRFNRWKMLSNATQDRKPGNVFTDDEKTFKLHGVIPKKNITEESPYEVCEGKILSNEKIKYVLLDISSECEIAQDKIYTSRVVPGIIIPAQYYDELKKRSEINKEPEYIFKSPQIELNHEDYYIIFNLNQIFFMDIDALYDSHFEFAFNEPVTVNIKQKAAHCVSKHGIESFVKRK